MTIKEKIKYIENYPSLGWSVRGDYYWYGDSGLPGCLKRNNFITQEQYQKLIKFNTNFSDYYWKNKELNSQSVLLINLVYKILKNKENNLHL
jgi:hypothetical protein